MAYAPSFTSRFKAYYRVVGREHVIMVRGYLGEDQTTTSNRARSTLRALFTALQGKLADDFVWIKSQYIPEDSESFTPETNPLSVTGALAVNTFSKKDGITPIHFAGKCTNTVGGLFVYGLQFSEDVTTAAAETDFLITTDEDADILAAVTALNLANIPGIDGTSIIFYNQVTLKTNDFYVKRVRKGS